MAGPEKGMLTLIHNRTVATSSTKTYVNSKTVFLASITSKLLTWTPSSVSCWKLYTSALRTPAYPLKMSEGPIPEFSPAALRLTTG